MVTPSFLCYLYITVVQISDEINAFHNKNKSLTFTLLSTNQSPSLTSADQTEHYINPQAPVAQKSADKVVFRHFQREGVEFF